MHFAFSSVLYRIPPRSYKGLPLPTPWTRLEWELKESKRPICDRCSRSSVAEYPMDEFPTSSLASSVP